MMSSSGAILSFVEESERAWWYQYKVQYFTSLGPTQKWLKAECNMSVGNVVLIRYGVSFFKSKSATSFTGTGFRALWLLRN